MDEPLSFALEAGPATASLEFIVGIVPGDRMSTWAALQTGPCWVDLGNKDASVSWVRCCFCCELRRSRIGKIVSFFILLICLLVFGVLIGMPRGRCLAPLTMARTTA